MEFVQRFDNKRTIYGSLVRPIISPKERNDVDSRKKFTSLNRTRDYNKSWRTKELQIRVMISFRRQNAILNKECRIYGSKLCGKKACSVDSIMIIAHLLEGT